MKNASSKRAKVSEKRNNSSEPETVAVILDADVADVFESSEEVNTVLRLAIRAMRVTGAKKAKTPAKRRAS